MKIGQYDKVILKDGRTGTIVEILEDGVGFNEDEIKSIEILD